MDFTPKQKKKCPIESFFPGSIKIEIGEKIEVASTQNDSTTTKDSISHALLSHPREF